MAESAHDRSRPRRVRRCSSFRGLYDELLNEDVTIIAPPNPLRGLTGGDGEYLKGVIGEIDGPVLLVGHSYGGSVITAAGHGRQRRRPRLHLRLRPGRRREPDRPAVQVPRAGNRPLHRPAPAAGRRPGVHARARGLPRVVLRRHPGRRRRVLRDLPAPPRRRRAHRGGADPGVAQPSGLGGARDRRPLHRPRRPPLQLRAHGRAGHRDRRRLARRHDLPPQGGRGGRHDRRAHVAAQPA